VQGFYGQDYSFKSSLIKKDGFLHPGKYYILVDPKWNECAEACPEYKQVVVDVYTTLELVDFKEEVGN
jgi:hypothetical protein